jgi:uncharacterized protein (TIGR03435 family)
MSLLIRRKLAFLLAARWVAVALMFLPGMMNCFSAHGQLQQAAEGAAPSFEVATVRPSRAEAVGTNYHLSTSRFEAENAPLTALIRFAYDIKSDDQLPKDPSWIASERFDVDAKVDDAAAEAMNKLLPDQKFKQFRLMLRSLLEDRFKLKVSTQMKELPVYALVVTKNGPKLNPLNLPPETAARRMPTISGGSRGELKAGACSMEMFTRWISGNNDIGNRVVIDATGLKGVYDFALSWTPDNIHTAQTNAASAGQGPANAAADDTSKPSIFTALQEQLGLKLESRKAPVEVLVIDHVEQPSPN